MFPPQQHNIHEMNNMTFNEAYTALSRGISLDKIHFTFTDKLFKKASEDPNPTKIKLIKPKKGEIYEMSIKKENRFYMGYTTTSTQKRFEEHKECVNMVKRKIGCQKKLKMCITFMKMILERLRLFILLIIVRRNLN